MLAFFVCPFLKQTYELFNKIMNPSIKKILSKAISSGICLSFLLTQTGLAAPYSQLRMRSAGNTSKSEELVKEHSSRDISPDYSEILKQHEKIKTFVRFTQHELSGLLNYLSAYFDTFYDGEKGPKIIMLEFSIRKMLDRLEYLFRSIRESENEKDPRKIADYNKRWMRILAALKKRIVAINRRIEISKDKIEPRDYEEMLSRNLSAYHVLEDLLCLLQNRPINNIKKINLNELFKKIRSVEIEMDPSIEILGKQGTLVVVIKNIQRNASEAAIARTPSPPSVPPLPLGEGGSEAQMSGG